MNNETNTLKKSTKKRKEYLSPLPEPIKETNCYLEINSLMKCLDWIYHQIMSHLCDLDVNHERTIKQPIYINLYYGMYGDCEATDSAFNVRHATKEYNLTMDRPFSESIEAYIKQEMIAVLRGDNIGGFHFPYEENFKYIEYERDAREVCAREIYSCFASDIIKMLNELVHVYDTLIDAKEEIPHNKPLCRRIDGFIDRIDSLTKEENIPEPNVLLAFLKHLDFITFELYYTEDVDIL